ncbi:DUF1152 domain-containing protein [Rhizohabitans arisaemae]|uniref:DUF1152 domain-containing protein n=1 Tax=Rhizohabitans arisaemae TaxID=2720610 RepID=UPI0024B1B903|nr:DUF1152 domain-containing protein [Rhizohabitans arisaemae]
MTLPTIEEAALTSRTALVMGHGGGSDCLVASLVADWLGRLGVQRIILGGVACQWWLPADAEPKIRRTTVGPDFYQPLDLKPAQPLGENAVIVLPDTQIDGRQPHEATAARHFGGEAFVVSLRGGGRGVADGMRQVIAHYGADLLVSVDVGSDTLSTGNEIRPTQTSLADHLTLAGLLQQECRSYFALAGYGVDGEMEIEELDRNLSTAVKAGALRGVVTASNAAIERVATLHDEAYDPVGSLVIKAGRGDFGLHRTLKSNPFGEVVRVGPAALPVWVFDPRIVADSVAAHAKDLVPTTTDAEAEQTYRSLGRIPEISLPRFVDFQR